MLPARSDLPMMGLREFRTKLSSNGSIKGPVLVVRTRGSIEIIGTWIPEPPKAP